MPDFGPPILTDHRGVAAEVTEPDMRRRLNPLRGRLLAVLAIALSAWLGWKALDFTLGANWNPVGLVLYVGPAVLAWALVAWDLGLRPRKAIARELAAFRCPACGQDLRMALRDRDGFTACPACGAAWRLRNTWVLGDFDHPQPLD